MTTVNQAKFKINGTASLDPLTGDKGYVAANSETLQLTLEVNPSPALGLRYEVYSSADPTSPLTSKGAPEIVFVGSGTYQQDMAGDINGVAEIQMPGSGVHSYIIRSVAVTPDGEQVWERMVVIPYTSTTPDLRKTVPGETDQFRARSWSDDFNDMVDAMGALIGSTYDMNQTYDIFGSNPAIVVIDGAEGQGDLRFQTIDENSFVVDITGCSGHHDGFLVNNGADYFNLIRSDTDEINLTSFLYSFGIFAAEPSSLIVEGAAADLLLGARGQTITLNQSGQESLDGAFTATSLIGALNELVSGVGLHTDLDEAYDNFGANPRTVNIDAATLTWEITGAYNFDIYLEGADASGFRVYDDADTFYIYKIGASSLSLRAEVATIYMDSGSSWTMNADTFIDIDAAEGVMMDTPSSISLDAAVASNFTVSGEDQDLTLGARASTITLNESGNASLDGFTATSIIGALNELKGDLLGWTLDDGYDAFGGGGTVAIDAGSLIWYPYTSYEYLIRVNNSDDDKGFRVQHYIPPNGSTTEFALLEDTDKLKLTSNLKSFSLIGIESSEINTSTEGADLTLNIMGSIDAYVSGDSGANGHLAVSKQGTAGSTTSILQLYNLRYAASMMNTGTAIDFLQYYNDGTPGPGDAGRIAVVTDSNWTADDSTWNSHMEFYVANAGNLTQVLYLANDGTLYGEFLSFADDNLGSSIPISESGVSGLSGFTATSVVGALNELKAGGVTGFTLDDAYNNDGGAASVAVDAGTLTWDVNGLYWFEVEISDAQEGEESRGFRVYDDGGYYFQCTEADGINLKANVLQFDIDAASWFSITGNYESYVEVIDYDLTIRTVSSGDLVLGAAEDLTLNDQYLSAAIPLSESGTTGLSGYSATSIVGALNEVMASVSGWTLDDSYNASAGASTVAVDAGTMTWDVNGAYDFVIEISGCTGDSVHGFAVEDAAGGDYFRIYKKQDLSLDLYAELRTGTLNFNSDLTLGCADLDVDVDSFAIDSTDDSTITVTGGNLIIDVNSADLTLQTTTSGDLNLTSAVDIVLGPAGNVVLEAKNIATDTTTGMKIGTATDQKLGFFNATPVVQPTELTDELTTITHTAPGTPDYAIQDLTNSSPYGFVTQDEGNTVLSVIANLQTRQNELETKLASLGLLADAD